MTPLKPLLTGWSLVRIRPGEPNKYKGKGQKSPQPLLLRKMALGYSLGYSMQEPFLVA